MSRRSIIFLCIVALPVLGLAACNALVTRLEASHAETVLALHREARVLVPTGARHIQETESACVEFRSYPSCVRIFFDLPGTDETRERRMQERVRTHGWTPAPDAPSFAYERGGLRASVRLQKRNSFWKKHCADRLGSELDRYARNQCLDSVLVSVT